RYGRDRRASPTRRSSDLCTSLGWRTRLSVSLSFVLYTYLNLLDSVSTITKYSCIASHALLLLSLSNCGAVWSVDHWLKRRRSARSEEHTSDSSHVKSSYA